MYPHFVNRGSVRDLWRFIRLRCRGCQRRNVFVNFLAHPCKRSLPCPDHVREPDRVFPLLCLRAGTQAAMQPTTLLPWFSAHPAGMAIATGRPAERSIPLGNPVCLRLLRLLEQCVDFLAIQTNGHVSHLPYSNPITGMYAPARVSQGFVQNRLFLLRLR